MRPSTAIRIAVAIGLAWAVTALIKLASGDPGATALIRQLFALAIFVGGIAWLGYRFRVLPRRRSFEDQAKEAGLHARADDPLGMLASSFELFGRAASARAVENTAWGMHHGREVVVVDYWYAPDSNPSRDDYRRVVCVVDTARPEWPDISVIPTGGAAILRDAVDPNQVDLESERFNRAFEVCATERAYATAMLDARMMEWLLLQPSGTGFEVAAGRLMVFGPRERASLEDVADALHRFDAFLDHVPSVIASLYPHTGAGTPARPDR